MALALPLLACLALQAPPAPAAPRIELAGLYDSGLGEATEIVSVQPATLRAVLASSARGSVDVLDLRLPSRPRRLARHQLELARGEALTSVALHPREPYYLAAVQAADCFAPGRVELRALADGALLARLPAGVGPDSVCVSPDGRTAALACEGEAFAFDQASGAHVSPPGSVTLVDLAGGPGEARARQVPLPPLEGVEGAVLPGHRRALEREVAEETVRIPLDSGAPALLEPECAAFSADGAALFVTLQESNALAVVDVASATVRGLHGLGTTTHAADLDQDGEVRFDGELTALREPDGIALVPGGALLVTADEGDTDPKASKVPAGLPAGGGRTLSVLDARTLRVLGDTGDQLDRACAAAGLYPDERSDAKGSEPEMVVAFELAGRPYAAVGLERAGALALVDLADPARPRVVSLAACRSDAELAADAAPEGLAWLREPLSGEVYVLAANEGDGTLSVFRVVP